MANRLNRGSVSTPPTAGAKATSAEGGVPGPSINQIANDQPGDRDYDDPYPGGATPMSGNAATG